MRPTPTASGTDGAFAVAQSEEAVLAHADRGEAGAELEAAQAGHAGGRVAIGIGRALLTPGRGGHDDPAAVAADERHQAR